MKVRFVCPGCSAPARADLPGLSWQCPACDHVLPLAPPQVSEGRGTALLLACAVCGNRELYKKKGFPHWLGLSILTGSCLAFLVLSLLYYQWWGWGILLGSAAVDGLLYWCVGDVVVCYRCRAHYSWTGPCGNAPFELIVEERYRQEKVRREQLQSRGQKSEVRGQKSEVSNDQETSPSDL